MDSVEVDASVPRAAAMRNPVFTVFTPTYNRAHLLHRVYNSLERQTFHDFEWLIIDDGSTDDTAEVVGGFRRMAGFPVRYIWQENGHKKKAFNHGVKQARGELFLPWDSDDEAVPQALEILYRHWMAIPDERRHTFAGVCGLCVDESGRLIGSAFPRDVFDSDSLECRYRYRVTGEKWGFSRTDILREHPFPEDVAGHVPEGLIWSSIAKCFKTRFVNQVVRIYRSEPDSITQTAARKGAAIQRIAEGHVLWARSVLENEIEWFFYDPAWFLRMASNYTRFLLHLRHGDGRWKPYRIDKFFAGLLVFTMWPVGFLRYRKDLNQRT